MTLSESTRVTISLCLSFLLTIGLVMTATALVILFKAFLNIKRKVLDYEKNLSLLKTESATTTTPTAAATSVETAMTSANVNAGKWPQKEGEESPTIVPTPPPSRRSGYRKQQEFTINIPRAQSSNSQEIPRDFSFTSNGTSRDSGTGSTNNRTPLSSISSESQMTTKKEWNHKVANRLSNGSQEHQNNTGSRNMSWGSGRTTSSASRGSQRAAREEPINENELRDSLSSRLYTMHIGNIFLDDNEFPDEKERQSQNNEEALAIEHIGFPNEGYHSDDNASKQSSAGFSRKARLANQESVSSLNDESVHFEMINNDMRNLDCEEEVFINQDIVDEVRLNSVGSRVDCNDKHEEPLYMNTTQVTRF